MAYARDHIQRLIPYSPGEQPDGEQVVKLNTNENPYPPPPQVLNAIQNITADQLRRYPPPDAQAFRTVAAEVHNLTPDMVMATNGGDELLRLAVTVFCACGQPAGGIGISDPTYSLYRTLADIHDTPITRVPLREDWSLDDGMAQRCLDSSCRLVLIVNPHAPSGRLRPLEQLAALAAALRGRAVLLIDEAYVDFAQHDALALLDRAKGLDNVLLLRSLSKGYSLAGLRFGYALGHHGLIAALDKARDSYNTDRLAQAAAIAALQHRDQAQKTWLAVKVQRRRLVEALLQRGYYVVSSESNFLLVTPPANGPGAAQIYELLKGKSIFVRYFDQERLDRMLRITVGTPQQNDQLLTALDAQ